MKSITNYLSSFVLVTIAAIIFLLLVVSIPLAFMLTYHKSGGNISQNERVPEPVHRYHNAWPSISTIRGKLSVQMYSLIPPDVNTCRAYGFFCTSDPGHKIGTNKRCDGIQDCKDGSDEHGCLDCLTSFSCGAPDGKGQKCLRGENTSNGVDDCIDGSDEKFFHHLMEDCDGFRCPFNHTRELCIPQEMVCDGDPHCQLKEDEENCTECQNDALFCKPKKICIPKWKLCDGEPNCPDGSDELDCDCVSCSGQATALCNGTRTTCVKKEKICDGVKDCHDGEDEAQCIGQCPLQPITKNMDKENKTVSEADNLMVTCSDGKEYSWFHACGGFNAKISDVCQNRCKKCYTATAFQCVPNQNSSTSGNESFVECIPRNMLCDYKRDCQNGTDEEGCDCNSNGKILCSAHPYTRQQCYTQEQKCDGYQDCQNGEDEMDCDHCAEHLFHCKSDRKCIPKTERCDGKPHCFDQSDELNCTCDECHLHPFAMYKCTAANRCFRFEDVCTPYTNCPNATNADSAFCSFRANTKKLF